MCSTQVGIPPETIKDSMTQGLPVPQYYVMPQETFCRTLGNSLGVNVAEFEFPAYYNFFLKVCIVLPRSRRSGGGQHPELRLKNQGCKTDTLHKPLSTTSRWLSV